MNVQTLKEMMIKYKGLLDELEELYRQLNDSGYLTPEFEEKMIQVQGEQDRILTELLPAFQAQYPALIKGLWEVAKVTVHLMLISTIYYCCPMARLWWLVVRRA